MVKRGMRCRSIVTRAGEGSVAWLPAKAGEALVVDTVLLVMPFVVTGKTECFFRFKIVNEEMV